MARINITPEEQGTTTYQAGSNLENNNTIHIIPEEQTFPSGRTARTKIHITPEEQSISETESE